MSGLCVILKSVFFFSLTLFDHSLLWMVHLTNLIPLIEILFSFICSKVVFFFLHKILADD